MMIKDASMLLIAITACLALSGCQSNKVPPPPGASLDPVPHTMYPRVMMFEGLADAVVIQPPIVEPSTDQRPMRVSVEMRSIRDYPLNVQYRFEFLDELGRPLSTNPPEVGWGFAHLEPLSPTVIEGSALDTRAANWRVFMRSAR